MEKLPTMKKKTIQLHLIQLHYGKKLWNEKNNNFYLWKNIEILKKTNFLK